ncbi:hypothetical protein D917_04021, partial [Trichinella nativa]
KQVDTPETEAKERDILLMKQEGVPKNPYPLGRIIECYEG